MNKHIYIGLSLSLLATIWMGCSKPSTDALVLREGVVNKFPYREGKVKISQHQSTHAIPQWQGLHVTETYYVNEGAPVTVLGYRAQERTIQAMDSVLWTLQPTSTINRMDWVLPIQHGFYKENYLGMNNSDYGGGIPMIDVWDKNNGLAIGLFEPELHDISMPVEWKQYGDEVSIALAYSYPEPITLNTGDTLHTFRSFAYRHQGDYFNALRTFSEYMQSQLGLQLPSSEPEAFEPVWCA